MSDSDHEHAAGDLPARPEAWLLVGPTGSGKTPLGDHLQAVGFQGRPCHHFDFGAQLRSTVQGFSRSSFSPDEVKFLRRVLEEGALLEDERFPLALNILNDFIVQRAVRPTDLLVLNGLPRHVGQARSLEGRLQVLAVIQLVCGAGVISARLARDSGGDRAGREDDMPELVERKLAQYSERTLPLIHHYQQKGAVIVPVEVTTETGPADILETINAGSGRD